MPRHSAPKWRRRVSNARLFAEPGVKPLFLGVDGRSLGDSERALFAAANPAGFILFGRNIETPDQVRALTSELRAISGRDRLPILVDQEGGRIARLGPPHWPSFPAAGTFGALYARAPVTAIESARLNARALAAMLAELGISVNCLPVLDMPVSGAHAIIGDRAYGSDVDTVAALGDATLRGLREGGIVGVVKHIPGHGRAAVDSHRERPVVTASREELERDFEPFRRLAGAPMAMTAHVTYTALDADACASQSSTVIGTIRRHIGFAGLLMTDDLGMHALDGPLEQRAARALAAGCDIALHGSGDFAENERLCEAAPALSPEGRARLDAAMRWPAATPAAITGTDLSALALARDALLSAAAA